MQYTNCIGFGEKFRLKCTRGFSSQTIHNNILIFWMNTYFCHSNWRIDLTDCNLPLLNMFQELKNAKKWCKLLWAVTSNLF
ncbi:hypothetical protein VC82_2043 [Flagellimonas lutaonensis]|uniref:Uncharacterized protein n=1 Tax=Flagellimonas lutaonensis TaxID=516051 RepID=A0A0D5YTJ4_9FLAO|nr:hypothetical protein VC82_2043 [Allomuricauda lutaonensis]